MKIVLLGYMASGKTIIANKLSEKVHLNHIDLDEYITQKENLKISKIFEKKGEIAFRLLENKYLKEILSKDDDLVISVGGGTPCYASNMDLIINNSKSIYLRASIETIYTRIINEKAKRPLVATIPNEKLREFIAKHLFERNTFYGQANYTIEVNNKSLNTIINEILASINQHY
jgi:shikimate kinase